MPAQPTTYLAQELKARRVTATLGHLSALPTETQAALAGLLLPRKFTAGQVICLEGDPSEFVYFLERGWVKAVRTATDGREQATMLLHDGEIFGDEAVFSRCAYALTIIALEEISAWAIEDKTLISLTKQFPELAAAFLEHLGSRVMYYIQLVEDLGLRSVQSRIASTLLNHAELSDGRLVVPRRNWATLDEMAARLGTVRDVISRSLNVLQREGILHLERSRIIILDPQKLLEHGKV